jgi:hypothetical protein
MVGKHSFEAAASELKVGAVGKRSKWDSMAVPSNRPLVRCINRGHHALDRPRHVLRHIEKVAQTIRPIVTPHLASLLGHRSSYGRTSAGLILIGVSTRSDNAKRRRGHR